MRHLLKIAFVNHQALNHIDGQPAYQRMINKKRVQKIGDFIKDGGYFPTNILINFVDNCRFEPLPKSYNESASTKFGMLYLPNEYRSAWVIDGQHRLYGFSNLDDQYLDTNLLVLAFEKLDPKKEADLFVTINHEQKSVPKSLLISLQGDLRMGSGDPKEALDALASKLIRDLNADVSSPFYSRFAKPDIVSNSTQNLTIPEATKGLTKSTLIGKKVNTKSRVSGLLSGSTDTETLKRARTVLNGYFTAIMEANPQRWNAGRSAYICVNPGIRAHLMLIDLILKYLAANNCLDVESEKSHTIIRHLTEFIAPLTKFFSEAHDKEIEDRFSRRFGEGGVQEYYHNLIELLVTDARPDFGGEAHKEFMARKTDKRFEIAARDLEDIQDLVSKIVIDTLIIKYGKKELSSGEKAYWDQGIESTEIKQKAYAKQQQDPPENRFPREAYLDFLDFMKIIRQKNNWPMFVDIFNIPLPSEKGKVYYLDWMEKINSLRRVTAHKSAYRTFDNEDFGLIVTIKEQLFDKAEKNGFQP